MVGDVEGSGGIILEDIFCLRSALARHQLHGYRSYIWVIGGMKKELVNGLQPVIPRPCACGLRVEMA